MRLIGLLGMAFVFFSVGCASPSSTEKFQTQSGQPSARVRFYGNNGMGATFYRNKNCVPRDESAGIHVSGSAQQAFSALLQMNQTETIGMPESPRSRELQNGILAKEFFKEFHVAANEPLAFSLGSTDIPRIAPKGYSALGSTVSCQVQGWFVPEPGKDYDVYLTVARIGANCASAVREINPVSENRIVSNYLAFACETPSNSDK